MVGAVDTHHETWGAGEPVLFLHGGYSSLETMRPQMDALSSTFTVYAPDRPGHGGTADLDGAITYPQSVADTLAYLDAVGVESAHVVGFSDGAIIGLMMAMDHPGRIRSLVAISGNLDPSGFVDGTIDDEDDSDGEAAAVEVPPAEAVAPAEAAASADPVLDKLMHLWTHEPHIDPAELASIAVPTLVMAGDHDVISLEHSALIAKSVSGGQLCIVPGAGHGLLDERPEFVTFAIQEFLGARR